MNYLCEGFGKYRLTYIHTDRQTDRQTNRETGTTEIIYHAASRVINDATNTKTVPDNNDKS